ncbi:MAG: hypothetical protein IRY89_13700 [Pseudolabrys sp.]|nr:hypothetical protein [Pseudolabrys sp.]
MLVARRDPLQDHGTHDHSPAYGRACAPRLARVLSLLQVAGTVVGIPVALTSAYSVYHANFSAEAVCQGLRSNIVAMLDKSADAATLRALVRRDVVNFERHCGTVDPEAVAAFKSLLAEKPAAGETAAKIPARNLAREAEARPATARPPVAAKAAPPAREPIAHDTRMSDAKWLEAVRAALLTRRGEEPARLELAAPPHALAPPAPARSETRFAVSPMPEGRLVAPLPPPTEIASPPAPASETDHPIPPASIPDASAAQLERPRHLSRWDAIMARIPVVNRLWNEERRED